MNEYLITLVGIDDSEEIEEIEQMIVESPDEGQAESKVYMAIDDMKLYQSLNWTIQSIQSVKDIHRVKTPKKRGLIYKIKSHFVL